MAAIEACRTPRLGDHVDACDDCGFTRVSYNSCRNRHCPKCQGAARKQWVAARIADLLPVPYFHVVFTLPPAVAEIAFQNKTVVYALLMRISAETLQTIAANPRWLGAEIGVTAVLHAWGQAMTHHPHVHCVVPGGGLSPERSTWIACRPGFFLPVRVLSRLFRRLFLAALAKAFAQGELHFFNDLAHLNDAVMFHPPSHAVSAHRMGRLCKAAFRRSGPGARLSRPIHPIASPSPTPASSNLMTTMLPSDGRIIGAMHVIARRSCAFILTSSSGGFSCTCFPPASTACVSSAFSPTVIDGIASLCAGCSLGSHRPQAGNPIPAKHNAGSPTNAQTAGAPRAGQVSTFRRWLRLDPHLSGATRHDAQHAVLPKMPRKARAFTPRSISCVPSVPNGWATAVHAADIPAKTPAGKAMNVNPPGPD